MKLIDGKGKLFGKLNLFDLAVIVVVLVALIAMVTRFATPKGSEETYMSATYTIEYKKMGSHYKDAFAVGDVLYEEGVELGTVTAVDVSLAQTKQILPDGSVGMVEHKNLYSIKLQVKTERLRENGGYYINTQEMLAGTSHDISNGFAKGTAVVREIIIQK